VGATPERLSEALASRYRIERELGQGGMATVYLAEDLKHKRHVALKVLKPELAAVLGAERFVQEITTTAALQHPHILPLFDSGEAGGFLYYVMPFIDGETLRDKLNRETQLGVDEAVRITTDVAEALHYAHEHGVIHRDIKPENILLANGRPMVADFGIALAVSAAAGGRMTETGLSLGTPHYMSPEQATAEKEITARSDVYSLASVLFEMLAGEPPHSGGSAQAIIMKIIAEPAQPVTKFRKSVPLNVAAAVAKALEKVPADRFASATTFAEALANPAFGASVAGVTNGLGAAGRPRRLVPALLFTVAVTTVAALWGWMRSMPPSPVVRYSMYMTPDQAISGLTTALGGRIALSPDGMLLAYVGQDLNAASPKVGIHLRNRGELTGARVPNTDDGRRPFFKPDGSAIGYFGADGSLHVVGVDGEPARRIGTERYYEVGGGVWGADGYIYAARLEGTSGIVRVPENGGPLEQVTVIDTSRGERFHNNPSVLPNGRGLFVYVRGAGDRDGIDVVDLRTMQRSALVAGTSAWYAPSGHLLYLTGDGSLMAAPFDDRTLRIQGVARAVATSVGVTRLGAELALSASGLLMYITGTAGFVVQPMYVEPDGKATPIDPSWTYPASSVYTTMSLSPDGARLVVSAGTEEGQRLFVKQLPRGPNMPLSFEGKVNSRAHWAPDGRSIFFTSDRSGRNETWREAADASAPATRVSSIAANDGFYSPDSTWFVYRGSSPDRHIFARRLRGDTSARVQVTSERGEDLAPTLSSDGRWLAYVGTENGRNEVYLRPFPDVNRSKVLVSTAGGIEPRWAPDGRALFYRTEGNMLVRVAVERRGDAVALGARQELFSMALMAQPNPFQATYDVTPDGRRFVMAQRLPTLAGADAEQLIVVENFLDHVKQVMKP
jgi:serine/threonine-protein kinase